MFNFLTFIGMQLFYNVVLVFTVQRSESAIRIHIPALFQISFQFRLSQSIEASSLSYTLGSYWLSSLYIQCICMCMCIYPSLSIYPTLTFPPRYSHICSLSQCLYFCFIYKIFCANFFTVHAFVPVLVPFPWESIHSHSL